MAVKKYWKISQVVMVNRTHWFGFRFLSRTPLAQFSWESKPNFRSSGFTVSYLFEMFFTTMEKCCFMLIFANEYAVLIESFEKGSRPRHFVTFCIDGANCFHCFHYKTCFCS